MVFPNTYAKIIKLLEAMNEAGVKPELECFDTGHTHGHLAARSTWACSSRRCSSRSS